MSKIVYPKFRKDETISDDYHGIQINDPYRWLEDPDAEETNNFVTAQNDITFPYIDRCPVKEAMKKRLTDMWDFPKYGCPFKRGSRYFYFYNSGLQNQSVLYVMDALDAEPRVFLDPNLLSADGTVALNGYSFSEDGELMAYGLSSGGSDWVKIKFMKVSTGEELPDVLERVKFSSMAWTHDNKGIFYNRYPEQEGKSDGTETTCNLNQKLMYHHLGAPQSEDVLCLERPDEPTWILTACMSECGRYVIVSLHEGCEPNNQLFYCDLEEVGYRITGALPLTTVVNTFEAVYEYVTNEGSVFTFRTNLSSPLYKLINIDLTAIDKTNWRDLVPTNESVLLEWASCTNQVNLVVCHLQDVKSVVSVYDLRSGDKLRTLDLPLGSVAGFSGRKKEAVSFLQFVSFLTPGISYLYDFGCPNPELKVFRETKIKDFDLTKFEVRQEFYKSKDGTRIPMFIVHPKETPLDGSNLCLLYGYGGFEISITPSFSISRLLLMQHFRGIYAVANIRGGGEYGERWHRAGRLANKQNCFDDFHAAAEFLIDRKYTNSKKLVIQGGSNGGLLVAACVNQRPELFAAGIAQVSVLDMLRFHKFTIGHAWTSDYGCSDNPEQFQWIIKYSPLHNIRVPTAPGVQYPALLLLTGDHDDRVVPLHTLKYVTQLQETVGRGHLDQTNPLLVRVDTKAGHGAGKPTAKTIDELADIYAFLQVALNLEWHD